MKLLVLITLCLTAVSSYRFLVCNPMPIRSTTLLAEGIVKHLLNAGHEIVFITAFPDNNNKNPNLRQIDISDSYQLMQSASFVNISYIMENSELNNVKFVQDITTEMATITAENMNLQRFMRETDQYFDAVIIDWLESDFYAGFAAVFQTHLIWSFSMSPYYYPLRLIDEHSNPRYMMEKIYITLPLLSLSTRIIGLWYNLERQVAHDTENSIYKSFFIPYAEIRGISLPSYVDAIYDRSLTIANAHHAIEMWPRTAQNLKFVGGCYIDDPPKQLPADLKELLDNASHGAIYFSMGSVWQSKDIPKEITEGLLNLFGKFKQTIIWKYEEELFNKPKNVHTLKWAPQISILAHPNVKFFITNGGLLSSTEAIHFGVPIIGIPIFFDQFHNMMRARSAGFAITVDLNYDLTKNLKAAMHEMLNNYVTYKEKAKEVQMRYHDRPVKPSVEVVHWIEHVVKTKGVPHIRSPVKHLNIYLEEILELENLVHSISLLFFILLGLELTIVNLTICNILGDILVD